MRVAAGLLALSLAASAPAAAEEPPAHEYVAKKDRRLAAKQTDLQPSAAERAAWHATLDRRIGKRPPQLVNIFNTWTHETLALASDGGDTLDKPTVDRFLRCHFTNEPADMDPAVFGVLVAAAKTFSVERVEIISGFRAPKYNLILRKKGRQVARTSQHTLGRAVDFRLPGVSIKRLHAWARKLRLGGVGLYVQSAFIHVDTGRIRYWNGR